MFLGKIFRKPAASPTAPRESEAEARIREFVNFWATHISAQIDTLIASIDKDFQPSWESLQRLLETLKHNHDRWQVFAEEATLRLVEGQPALKQLVIRNARLVRQLGELHQRMRKRCTNAQQAVFRSGGPRVARESISAASTIEAKNALSALRQGLGQIAAEMRKT